MTVQVLPNGLGSLTSCGVKSNSTVRFQSTLKTQNVSFFVDIYLYSLNSLFIMFLFSLLYIAVTYNCCLCIHFPCFCMALSATLHPSAPSFHSEQPEKSLEIYSLYFPPVTGNQALNLSNPPITQELTVTIW